MAAPESPFADRLLMALATGAGAIVGLHVMCHTYATGPLAQVSWFDCFVMVGFFRLANYR